MSIPKEVGDYFRIKDTAIKSRNSVRDDIDIANKYGNIEMVYNQGNVDRLVKSVMPLCAKFASSFARKWRYPIEDMYSAACMGAVEAANKYLHTPIEDRYAKDAKFVTMAFIWIRKACQREIANNKSQFAHTNKETGGAVKKQYDFVSFDAPLKFGDESEMDRWDALGADDQELKKIGGELESLNNVVKLLANNLDPKERKVVIAFFGLDGKPPRNNKQAAAEAGVSPGKASGVINGSLKKMRAEASNPVYREALSTLAFYNGYSLADAGNYNKL